MDAMVVVGVVVSTFPFEKDDDVKIMESRKNYSNKTENVICPGVCVQLLYVRR